MPVFQDSFRVRGYPHFDIPSGLAGAQRLATDKHRVEKHGFYPFIRREVRTPRYHKSLGKVEDKVRCVDYASHADAAIYGWYGALLNERYEAKLRSSGELHDIPIAYRKWTNRAIFTLLNALLAGRETIYPVSCCVSTSRVSLTRSTMTCSSVSGARF
jgi:hypothetical protein